MPSSMFKEMGSGGGGYGGSGGQSYDVQPIQMEMASYGGSQPGRGYSASTNDYWYGDFGEEYMGTNEHPTIVESPLPYNDETPTPQVNRETRR